MKWLTLTVNTGGRVFTTHMGKVPRVKAGVAITIVQTVDLSIVGAPDLVQL